MTQVRSLPMEQSGRSKRNGDTAGPPTFDRWARASHVALIGLFVLAVLWSAHIAQPVLVPILLAWVIATIIHPIVEFLQGYRVPRVLGAVLTTLAFMSIVCCLLLLLSTPIAYWLGRASELGLLIKQKLAMINQPLAFLGELRQTLSSIAGGDVGALKVEQPGPSVVSTIFAVLTPAVSQFILFVGALLFYLIYQQRIHRGAVLLLRNRNARLTALRVLSGVDENMTTYFSTFTLVNVCLASVTVLLTWLAGLPNPLLWGVLAGVLNYVPYIGPAIVAATLAVVGLLTFPTLGQAAVAPLSFIAITAIEGNILTPALMGKRLEVNPFAVFLSIAFCTWLWGPIGAFLAVPLLMAASVSYDHIFTDQKADLPD